MPRPPTPAVIARLARADGVAPSIRNRCKRALRAQAREAAKRVAEGMAPIPSGPSLAALEDRWADDLFTAKRPGTIKGANDGYVLAERAMPSKSYAARLSSARSIALIGKAVDVGGEDDFIRRMEPQPVDKWLEESSSLETETSIKKYNEEYERLINYRDPETGFGLNPKQMARRLLDQGLAWSVTRADLMARTTSIWALNEGAGQFYRDAGFRRFEWMATEDDATCPICLDLDGRTWDASEPLFEAGDIVSAGDISLSLPFDIQHPPIHPYDRCTLLPVID